MNVKGFVTSGEREEEEVEEEESGLPFCTTPPSHLLPELSKLSKLFDWILNEEEGNGRPLCIKPPSHLIPDLPVIRGNIIYDFEFEFKYKGGGRGREWSAVLYQTSIPPPSWLPCGLRKTMFYFWDLNLILLLGLPKIEKKLSLF